MLLVLQGLYQIEYEVRQVSCEDLLVTSATRVDSAFLLQNNAGSCLSLDHTADKVSARCTDLQAAALLKDIDFFSLPQTLLDAAHAESVVQAMMRFLDAAAALGDDFLRCPCNDSVLSSGVDIKLLLIPSLLPSAVISTDGFVLEVPMHLAAGHKAQFFWSTSRSPVCDPDYTHRLSVHSCATAALSCNPWQASAAPQAHVWADLPVTWKCHSFAMVYTGRGALQKWALMHSAAA